MKFTLTINCDGPAFEYNIEAYDGKDVPEYGQLERELGCIIREVGHQVTKGCSDPRFIKTVTDSNNQVCGEYSFNND